MHITSLRYWGRMSYSVFDKHEDFKKFKENAKELLSDSLEKYKNDDFGKQYGLSICPGGWDGGQDINRVDVTYGSIPIGRMVERDKSFPYKTHQRIEADQGACMMIYHYGNGKTIISLYPAHTERIHPRENEILLSCFYSPKKLMKRRNVNKLLRYLKAYMAVTSSVGIASLFDLLLVAWLRFTRIRIVEKKQESIIWIKCIRKLVAFIFQIGFSGFVVVLVLEKIFTK